MSEHAIREYLKTIGSGGGGVSEETDPVFTASPAHGISAQDIADWNDKQEELVSGTNIKTINGQSLLGSGDLPVAPPVTSTDVPTADTISEFDSDAHMNSTDMTTGSGSELETFISGLIAGGGGVDSGTNYIKIGGIGICWGYTNLPAMSSPNGYAYATPTFPITFKSAPVVMPFLSAGFGAGRVIGVQAIHNAQTTTQGSIFVTNNAGGDTVASTNGIGWVAFGQV